MVQKHTSPEHPSLTFFLLVFILSVPFWIIDALTNNTSLLPAQLPVGALMAITPIIAAIILIYRYEGGNGVKKFFHRIFLGPQKKKWYTIAFLFVPVIMLISYGI